MSFVEIGTRMPKSDNNPFGWRYVETVPCDETCVIVLGGTGTNEDNVANGYAKKVINEYLVDFPYFVPVYSVKYNFEEGQKNSFARHLLHIKYGNKKNADIYHSRAVADDYNPRYIKDLFEKVIEPRLSKNNGKHRLQLLDACKNIRKLNIIAHCHGAYVALKLEEMMQNKMQEIGYDFYERQLIQEQLFVAAHSPACPLGKSKSQFVSFLSAMDVLLEKPLTSFGYFLKSKGDNRKKEDFFEPCYFDKKQGNLFLVYEKFKAEFDCQSIEGENSEHMMSLSYHPKNTTQGMLIYTIAKRLTLNAIYNSLQQNKNTFIPMPSIDDLLALNTKHCKKIYNDALGLMRKNGTNLRQQICKKILDDRKARKTRG